MIVGIGLDLIEIDRVARACEKESFMIRCFTTKEIEMIHKDYKKAAGNFAVKEAVAKLFGTGFRNLSLLEIEVLRDSQGKPYVNLYGKAKQMANELGITAIHVSITNTKDFANAVAIGEDVGERL